MDNIGLAFLGLGFLIFMIVFMGKALNEFNMIAAKMIDKDYKFPEEIAEEEEYFKEKERMNNIYLEKVKAEKSHRIMI